MKEHGHWGKFSDAQRDLSTTKFKPVYQSEIDESLRLLPVAQRFYLPNARHVLNEVDPVKELFKLPFPVTALLTECLWEEEPPSWKIVIGVDPRAFATNVDVSTYPKNSWLIRTLLSNDRQWIPAPPVCWMVVDIDPEQPGVTIGAGSKDHPLFNVWVREYAKSEQCSLETASRTLITNVNSDVASMLNFLLLLNLKNTEPIKVGPPTALQKKRSASNQLPLYDYHVLKIGGEVWNSPYEEPTGEGPGRRSHLRRGHIRRLLLGKTWVRATYVNGSVPGFVDKDYEA